MSDAVVMSDLVPQRVGRDGWAVVFDLSGQAPTAGQITLAREQVQLALKRLMGAMATIAVVCLLALFLLGPYVALSIACALVLLMLVQGVFVKQRRKGYPQAHQVNLWLSRQYLEPVTGDTQGELLRNARNFGIHENYVTMIEQQDRPLTTVEAKLLAHQLQVDSID